MEELIDEENCSLEDELLPKELTRLWDLGNSQTWLSRSANCDPNSTVDLHAFLNRRISDSLSMPDNIANNSTGVCNLHSEEISFSRSLEQNASTSTVILDRHYSPVRNEMNDSDDLLNKTFWYPINSDEDIQPALNESYVICPEADGFQLITASTPVKNRLNVTRRFSHDQNQRLPNHRNEETMLLTDSRDNLQSDSPRRVHQRSLSDSKLHESLRLESTFSIKESISSDRLKSRIPLPSSKAGQTRSN